MCARRCKRIFSPVCELFACAAFWHRNLARFHMRSCCNTIIILHRYRECILCHFNCNGARVVCFTFAVKDHTQFAHACAFISLCVRFDRNVMPAVCVCVCFTDTRRTMDNYVRVTTLQTTIRAALTYQCTRACTAAKSRHPARMGLLLFRAHSQQHRALV